MQKFLGRLSDLCSASLSISSDLPRHLPALVRDMPFTSGVRAPRRFERLKRLLADSALISFDVYFALKCWQVVGVLISTGQVTVQP